MMAEKPNKTSAKLDEWLAGWLDYKWLSINPGYPCLDVCRAWFCQMPLLVLSKECGANLEICRWHHFRSNHKHSGEQGKNWELSDQIKGMVWKKKDAKCKARHRSRNLKPIYKVGGKKEDVCKVQSMEISWNK